MRTKAYITDIKPLQDEGLFKTLYELMPEERKNKIDALRSLRDKERSMAVELCLQYALFKAGEDIHPEIIKGQRGKPGFKDLPIFFNLSHSGDKAMCVISPSEVGCDIENADKKANLKVAARFFSKEEYESITSPSDFFRLWTLKESYIKLVGDGLSMPLDSFSFVETCDKISLCGHEEEVSFFNGLTDDNYCYSIAVKGKNSTCDIEILNLLKIKGELYEG